MAGEIATALLPVFFVVALGYAAGRARIVDNGNVSSLNTLVMFFALPISLFTSLATSSRHEIITRWPLLLIGFVVMSVVYAGTYVMHRRWFASTPAQAAVEAISVAFPNCAAIGLPLVSLAIGPSATLGVAAILALGSITLSPLTLVILEKAQQPAGGLGFFHVMRDSLAKPIVIGPVLGLAWSFAGIPVPHLLQVTLTAMGSATSGLALFLTGLVLSGLAIEFTKDAYVSTALTILVRPALAFLAIAGLGRTGVIAQETLLLLAIPAGFFGILLGNGYGIKSPLAGTTVLFSTIGSLVTLSALIALLPNL